VQASTLFEAGAAALAGLRQRSRPLTAMMQRSNVTLITGTDTSFKLERPTDALVARTLHDRPSSGPLMVSPQRWSPAGRS
jgi:hypothetical protein